MGTRGKPPWERIASAMPAPGVETLVGPNEASKPLPADRSAVKTAFPYGAWEREKTKIAPDF